MKKEEPLSRRKMIGVVGGFVAVEILGAGCSKQPPLTEGQVAIPLAQLSSGRRVVVVVAGNPVEVTRSEGRVTARMLRCTHWGCVVRWNEIRHAYVCPCHDGTYDENGNVLAGPPPLPLRTVPVSVSEDRVVVGT